jgi:hypothetical protein
MPKDDAGKFIMKVDMRVNRGQLELFEKVGEAKHPKLITYYGKEDKSEEETNYERDGGGVNVECKMSSNSPDKEIDVPLYWEYLNWDLESESKHLEQKQELIKEDALWEILDNIFAAALHLHTFSLYPEIRTKTVQFTAGREPKLYWCELLPNNMHRAYERFLNFGEFRHTLYAPEELL